MNKTVFEMVHEVLGEAKRKQASVKVPSGVEKKAAQTVQALRPQGDLSTARLLKLADACDHLAKNIHAVADHRSPQEKLAEYALIHKALQKRAFEVGDEAPPEPTEEVETGEGSKGPHQTREAPSDSQSPKTVSLNSSGTGVGGSNAIPSGPTMTPGTSMDAGESGEATGANQPSQYVVPTEKPNPQDAANAFETNLNMMMASQPDDLLKQPGGAESTGSKTAQARALRVLDRVSGKADIRAREKIAGIKRVNVLLQKAAHAGIPIDVAAAMLGLATKTAEDALYPAQISAGSEPALQSEPGIPSQLSQGSEAGSNTPRGSAPTSGEGGGREALTSMEAAINYSKGQAKNQNRGALAELLTEPMQSSAHDKVLQESLDNTSSAGVKISAAREMIRKYLDASPGNAQKVAYLLKKADGEEMMGDAAPMEANPMADDGVPMDESSPDVSPEALAAVEAGVTPEELALAEELLATQGGMAEGQEVPGMEGAPEGVEKQEQMGGSMGAPMGASPSQAPSPMMS